MVVIDLTPPAFRQNLIGVRRLSCLRTGVIAVLAVAALCSLCLVYSAGAGHVTELRSMQANVRELEQQMRARDEADVLAKRDREQSVLVATQRVLIAELLAVVSQEVSSGLSIVKLHSTVDEAVVTGYAQDARTATEFFERITRRCPGLTVEIDGMKHVLVADHAIESFTARLQIEVQRYGDRWCQGGGPLG